MPSIQLMPIKCSGHHLEEIRTRAFHTIISKLDYGLISENQLADKDNLFPNLVKWFQYEKVPFKEDVLNLILRILKVSMYKIKKCLQYS